MRESLSARLDGEVGSRSIDDVDAHVGGCANCALWFARVSELHRSVRVRAAEVEPDRTSEILGALAGEAP